jgi:3-methyladenine DNA glycosylase AlkD
MSVSLVDWREYARELLSREAGQTTSSTSLHGLPHADLPLNDIKSAVKTFRANQWQLGPKSAFEFLNLVIVDRQHDEILFGVYLLTLFKRSLPADVWPAMERWLDHIDHWVICDQLAINLAGRLVAEDRSRWKTIQSWSRSEHQWRRRFAVTTACITLNKGGCKPKDILKLVEPLMNDDSLHVQNVVAWAIRQVAAEDEHLALGFLKKWKGRCNHEIFREAALRLSPDAKMTLLKAKSHQV